ncbi:hypothetical protein [Salana multivorans]|uniref:hypothetical protein n=1 Tax=Salana multivorans TaxID=120377 RepID=UPI00249361DD|nr:hypothetical protein [Salana multivorans]
MRHWKHCDNGLEHLTDQELVDERERLLVATAAPGSREEDLAALHIVESEIAYRATPSLDEQVEARQEYP